MTNEQLILSGWEPKSCKIGTLYFKDGFFCELKDGKAVVFSVDNDMIPIGEAETFSDIREIQKEYARKTIKLMEFSLEMKKKIFKEDYGEEI